MIVRPAYAAPTAPEKARQRPRGLLDHTIPRFPPPDAYLRHWLTRAPILQGDPR